jgi:hypothetical protein
MHASPKPPRLTPGQQRLTPEQETWAREFTQERIAAMLSTAEIDEAEAEGHLRQMYQVQGMVPPERIRWFDSPLRFILADSPRWIGSNMWRNESDCQEAAQGGGIVFDDINSVIDDDETFDKTFSLELWDSVNTIIGNDMYDSLGGEDGHELFGLQGEMAALLTVLVRERVEANLWEKVEWDLSGSVAVNLSLIAYWYASTFSVFRLYHELYLPQAQIHSARFNEMVSGYALGPTEAWVVHKPTQLLRDTQGRLHCSDGPCLAYRDGVQGYAWHGVLVPEQLILHPEQITKDDWRHESDPEVRHSMQEILGNERFVALMEGT